MGLLALSAISMDPFVSFFICAIIALNVFCDDMLLQKCYMTSSDTKGLLTVPGKAKLDNVVN